MKPATKQCVAVFFCFLACWSHVSALDSKVQIHRTIKGVRKRVRPLMDSIAKLEEGQAQMMKNQADMMAQLKKIEVEQSISKDCPECPHSNSVSDSTSVGDAEAEEEEHDAEEPVSNEDLKNLEEGDKEEDSGDSEAESASVDDAGDAESDKDEEHDTEEAEDAESDKDEEHDTEESEDAESDKDEEHDTEESVSDNDDKATESGDDESESSSGDDESKSSSGDDESESSSANDVGAGDWFETKMLTVCMHKDPKRVTNVVAEALKHAPILKKLTRVRKFIGKKVTAALGKAMTKTTEFCGESKEFKKIKNLHAVFEKESHALVELRLGKFVIYQVGTGDQVAKHQKPTDDAAPGAKCTDCKCSMFVEGKKLKGKKTKPLQSAMGQLLYPGECNDETLVKNCGEGSTNDEDSSFLEKSSKFFFKKKKKKHEPVAKPKQAPMGLGASVCRHFADNRVSFNAGKTHGDDSVVFYIQEQAEDQAEKVEPEPLEVKLDKATICKKRKGAKKGSATWCACNRKKKLIADEKRCVSKGGKRSDFCEWNDAEKMCMMKKDARFLEEDSSVTKKSSWFFKGKKKNAEKKLSKAGRMAAEEEKGWNARKASMPQWKQHQIGIDTCKAPISGAKRFLANKMFINPMGYQMKMCSDTKYSADEMVVVSKSCGDFSAKDKKVLAKIQATEKKELGFLELGEGLNMQMMLEQLHHHALGQVVGDAHGEMLHGVMAHLVPLFNEMPEGGLTEENFQNILHDVSSRFSAEDIPQDRPLHKLMSTKMLSFIEEMSSEMSQEDLDETMEGMEGTETDMEMLLEILFWGLMIFLFGAILMKVLIFLISVGFFVLVIGLVILIVVLTLIVSKVWHMFDFKELSQIGDRHPGASLVPARARARVEQHLASKMAASKMMLL